MTQRISIDAMLSPQGARVVQTVDADGRVAEARFDLAALPRVDAHLVGQPVAEVPRIVERLCGICPVAHHLAGVRALEQLWGIEVDAGAEGVRRLLHHGSIVDALAVRLFEVERASALGLRRVGKLAMKAAGSPGHFPVTAVVGGVAGGRDAEALAELRAAIPEALQAAGRLVGSSRGLGASTGFAGPDVALVDEQERLDLMGSRLRAVSASGELVVDGAMAADWPELVGESRPGEIAPRPVLLAGGQSYRVGPVAQLRATTLGTPLAETARRRWLGSDAVVAARAIVLLHALEVIARLADDAVLASVEAAPAVELAPRAGFGIGWVESPRGLLVHRYESDAQGVLSSAQILTPTAQNEPWLAQMLTGAATREQMEASIQAADPCLPCVSAPSGTMDVTVVTDINQEA